MSRNKFIILILLILFLLTGISRISVAEDPEVYAQISINGGAMYTNSTSVNLLLYCSVWVEPWGYANIDYVVLWDNKNSQINGVGVSGEYYEEKSWTLPPGEGPKAVYVEYYYSYQEDPPNGEWHYGSVQRNAMITLDTTPPKISDLKVNPTIAKAGTDLIITFTVNETLQGNPLVTVPENGATFSSQSGNNYTYNYAVQGTETQGDNRVIVSARDLAGNTGSASTPVTFDFTEPTVSATPPSSNWTNKDISITLSATDSGGSGLVEAKYRWDNSDAKNGTLYTDGMVITLTSEGMHKLYLWGRDNAGNENTWSGVYGLDKTNPTISNLTVNPTIAKAGTNLTITFTVSETLQGNPTVTVAGNGATFSSNSGNNYTYNYVVQGIEGEGSKPVNVSATDLAGNQDSKSTTVTFDFTAPTINPLTVNPTTAKTGTNLTITFTVSETLEGNPTVTVAGKTAIFNSKSGNNYIYTYAVQGTEGEGSKAVDVSATDSAGNTGSGNTTVTFDFTSPTISNLTVNPTIAKAGTNLTITFTVSETLQGNPTVTVAGNGATFSSNSGNNYTYTYTVKGTEGEGSKPVNVSATDLAWNTGSGSTTVTFDFTAPTINPLTVNPTTAKTGTNLTITFTVNETLQDNPTVTVAGNGATFSSKSGNNYTYTYTVKGTEGEGSKAVDVSATDSAGNTGSGNTTVTFDFTSPTISNLTVNPTIAKAGTNLTITFTVSETLQDNPTVTVAGKTAIFNTKSGNNYIYTYAVQGTEGEGSKPVNVSATDLAGNQASKSTTVTFDFTAPTINPLTVNPAIAKAGTNLTITFTVSETLQGNPTVTVAGNGATFSSRSGNNYTYTYTVKGTEGEGSKAVDVSATDSAGNTGSGSTTVTFDFTAPTVSAAPASSNWTNHDISIALSATDSGGSGIALKQYKWDTGSWTDFPSGNQITLSSEGVHTLYLQAKDNAGNWSNSWSGVYKLDKTPPTISSLTVNPAIAKAGTNLTITFTVSETLQGNPTVTVAGNGATFSSNSGNNYTYNYVVQGTEGEGSKPVNVSATDLAGNQASKSTTVTFDFTAPTINPLTVNPTTAKTGANLTITFTVSETLQDYPTVTVAGNGATFSSNSGNNYTYTYTVKGTEGEGDKAVNVSATDSAGNTGSGNTTVTFDFTSPTISNLTINPTIAKAGANLTITFTVSETLQDYPTVTVAGNGATFSSKSGNNYTYTYTVKGTEGEGSKPVNVSATDSAGNQASKSTTVTFDFTAPTINPLTVNPTTAKTGMNLTITFTVNEALQGNPTVTVAGNGATFSSKSGNNYTYTYTVKGTEGEGDKAVNVSATDSAEHTVYVSTTVIFDFTEPTCSADKSGDWHAENITITLTAEDDRAGSEIARYNWDTPAFETIGTEYSDGDTIILATETGENGKELYLYVKDKAGNTQTWNGTYYLDKTPPSNCSISINGGDEFTRSISVTLTLSASDNLSGVSKMKLSNDGTTWTEYDYATSKSWTLTDGDGTRTVYVMYKDNAGNWSNPVSDTIRLDTQAPANPTLVLSDQTSGSTSYTNSRTVNVVVGNDSGIDKWLISESQSGRPEEGNPDWDIKPSTFTLSDGDGQKTVYIWVKDAAGNINLDPVSARITLDRQAPGNPTLVLKDRTTGSTDYTNSPIVVAEVLNDDSVDKWLISESQNSQPAENDPFWGNELTAFTLSSGDGQKTVYIWVKDAAGNINPDPVSATITLDTTLPSVISLVVGGRTILDGEIVGVVPETRMEVEFSKVMRRSALEEGLELIAVKNNLDEEINKKVSLNFDWSADTCTVRVTPDSGKLEKNYIYKLQVTDKVTDLAGNTVEGKREIIFRTIMDHTKKNVVSKEINGRIIIVTFEANALTRDGYLVINPDPLNHPERVDPQKIVKANEKITNNGDRYQYPIDGCLWEFNVYDENGEWMENGFKSEVKIVLPYTDEGNGMVGNASIPVREETLSAFWLNEEHSNWVKVPDSRVDKDKDVVTAKVPEFSVYALMGSGYYDLSNAYAYPVPWKPNDGKKETGTEEEGITFTNLSSECVIKVYTISGELVMEHEYKGGGNWKWDVKTTPNKEKVFSGVYIYYIKNDKEHKTGKLIIIR